VLSAVIQDPQHFVLLLLLLGLAAINIPSAHVSSIFDDF